VVGEHLGDVYVKKALWEKALKTYRRVLEINPAPKDKENINKKIKEVQQRLDEEKGGTENPTNL
jgi:predicted negative regulator of RcsB-dependent stress response